MKLILVRHGETVENVNKICQGQIDGTLTEKGIEQAKKLGLRFKGVKLDAIYSSDSGRAKNTAKKIAKYHAHLTLNLDKRMRERAYGDLEGKPWPKEKLDWANLPENIETDQNVRDRGKAFIDDLYSKHQQDTVLVVSHGGMKMALLTLLHNQPISKIQEWRGIKNTSVSEFEIEEDGNHKIHLINCTDHLGHADKILF